MDYTERHKQLELESAEGARHSRHAHYKPFGPEWGSDYFGKWQTIAYALFALGIEPGATVLDVGMGQGWTTVFLAESGFTPTGIDIAPANVAIATERAERYGAAAQFAATDMDTLDLGRAFDAALVFDALHHTTRQREAVRRIAAHLRPGGWVLFGEPSWLHALSPHARRTTKELGWVERGIGVRSLKRDCRLAGLGAFRRFYEGTNPHGGRPRDFLWQTARLAGARASSAPQMSIWLAAQKLPVA
ncbi:MAG: hypothetical protein QOH43_3124 [Solirubrobacteraceae bacterium]|jgi:2-polyprenyl-3-methyl-5-hydroxy-6-metoxy-1,4-benzoquinol methylase|nr:hypothetical protein [Solirubrobacteraceae bacterium]